MKSVLVSTLVLTFAWAAGLHAADAPRGATPSNNAAPKPEKTDKSEPPAVQVPDARTKPSRTNRVITIGGQRVAYTVETGMMPLLKADGTIRANVFYIAYTRDGITNLSQRPLTFCFNGGPGSSSVWLHLGGLAPRRVKLNDDGTMPPPPFQLVDNEYSILNATDLVFIDPVATGYSRAAKDQPAEQFFGQSGDIESVGDFIRMWTTRQHRWLSPKYLCGESYGVFRAAGLAEHLHSRYGLYLNGVLLVSGLLDFATLREGPGNELPSLVFLPTYTAIAHFHGKLPPDLQTNRAAALNEARQFALREYPAILHQGDALPAAERKLAIAKLARLTGLPESVIADRNLRVDTSSFRELLLRDRNQIVGRFDGRITGRDADRTGSSPRFDPSYSSTYGPFSAAMNAYLRDELNFENDLPYEILTGVGPWNYDARSSYPSVADRLASAMNQNPYLRVLVLGGLTDLACPIEGIKFSIDHMSIDPSVRKNITYTEYESGHMMYVNLPDLRKMQVDMVKFLTP